MKKTNILKLALTLTGGMLLGTIFIVLAISWTGPTATPPGGFTGTLITQDPIFIDGGNVGIGTTTPREKLEIAGSIQTNTGNVVINDAGGNKLTIGHDVDLPTWIQFRPEGADGLAFLSGPDSAAMVVTNTGNVGIGTTVPTAKLHISGIAGTDGIRFPDGTKQTTAAGGGDGTFTGDLDAPNLIRDGCYWRRMSGAQYGGRVQICTEGKFVAGMRTHNWNNRVVHITLLCCGL